MADPSGYGSATTYTNNTNSTDSVKSSHRYFQNNLREHQEIKPEDHQAITIRVYVCVLKQEIDAIVDTGAEVTVVGAHIFFFSIQFNSIYFPCLQLEYMRIQSSKQLAINTFKVHNSSSQQELVLQRIYIIYILYSRLFFPPHSSPRT